MKKKILLPVLLAVMTLAGSMQALAVESDMSPLNTDEALLEAYGEVHGKKHPMPKSEGGKRLKYEEEYGLYSSYSKTVELLNLRVFSYDSQGNLVSETYDSDAGGGTGKYEYIYDDEGRLIRKITTSGKSQPYIDGEYIYDSEGRLIKEYTNSKRTCWIEYSYDEHGRLAKYICNSGTEDTEDDKVMTYSYDYDDAGRLVKKTATGHPYLPGLESAGWYEYIYDEQGRLIRENFYREYGCWSDEIHYVTGCALYSWFDYSYDGQGRLAGAASYRFELDSWYDWLKKGEESPKIETRGIRQYSYDSEGDLIRVGKGNDSFYTLYIYE